MAILQQTIESILAQSEKEQWFFPQEFQALKDAGITSYHVCWQGTPMIIYKSEEAEWRNENASKLPDDLSINLVADSFSKEAFDEALQKRMAHITTYKQFIKDISLAGISHYDVCMIDRTVTYHGKSETSCLVQRVP